MKKVAAINDICGIGKCSLVADISVLGAMGIQVCPLPTGIYTAQTVYLQHQNKSNTDMIDAFTENWSAMGETFDGIITGFLLDPGQAGKVLNFVRRFHGPDTVLLVDPVMGDEGVTYANYSEELHAIIAQLAEEADVLTPNLGELFLLAGETIARAELLWTADGADVRWDLRRWESRVLEDFDAVSGTVSADLPADAFAWVLNLVTDDGLVFSTPYAERRP